MNKLSIFASIGLCAVSISGYAFETLELNRVCADVFEGNVASEKVLKKCGFCREGVAREKYFKNGRYFDTILYGILRREVSS